MNISNVEIKDILANQGKLPHQLHIDNHRELVMKEEETKKNHDHSNDKISNDKVKKSPVERQISIDKKRNLPLDYKTSDDRYNAYELLNMNLNLDKDILNDIGNSTNGIVTKREKMIEKQLKNRENKIVELIEFYKKQLTKTHQDIWYAVTKHISNREIRKVLAERKNKFVVSVHNPIGWFPYFYFRYADDHKDKLRIQRLWPGYSYNDKRIQNKKDDFKFVDKTSNLLYKPIWDFYDYFNIHIRRRFFVFDQSIIPTKKYVKKNEVAAYFTQQQSHEFFIQQKK